jgi:hypothetical protein
MPAATHHQSARTLQRATTRLPVDAVIATATAFFATRNGVYAAFPEKEGPGFAVYRGQGGEEIVIGARAVDGVTHVTASSYMFDQQVARFLATLPPAPEMMAPAEDPAAVEGEA